VINRADTILMSLKELHMTLLEAIEADGPEEYGRYQIAAIDLNDSSYYSRGIFAYVSKGCYKFYKQGSRVKDNKYAFTESEQLTREEAEEFINRNDWIPNHQMRSRLCNMNVNNSKPLNLFLMVSGKMQRSLFTGSILPQENCIVLTACTKRERGTIAHYTTKFGGVSLLA
jgi:hypothetical protein